MRFLARHLPDQASDHAGDDQKLALEIAQKLHLEIAAIQKASWRDVWQPT
jgi:hypothetical protein